MHNIKLIRKEPDIFLNKLIKRNLNINLKNLLDLDKKNRDLIQKKEEVISLQEKLNTEFREKFGQAYKIQEKQSRISELDKIKDSSLTDLIFSQV